MSNDQIQQILKRLDQQDAVFQSIRKDIKDLQEQLQPINDVFHNATGFGRITVSILKSLALLGAGIGVIYAFISWIRQ